jgi:hypothetical protein
LILSRSGPTLMHTHEPTMNDSRRRCDHSQRARAWSHAQPNKRMQLTKRGGWCPRWLFLSRASQLIRGVVRTPRRRYVSVEGNLVGLEHGHGRQERTAATHH